MFGSCLQSFRHKYQNLSHVVVLAEFPPSSINTAEKYQSNAVEFFCILFFHLHICCI